MTRECKTFSDRIVQMILSGKYDSLTVSEFAAVVKEVKKEQNETVKHDR